MREPTGGDSPLSFDGDKVALELSVLQTALDNDTLSQLNDAKLKRAREASNRLERQSTGQEIEGCTDLR
jgi:hypothetical protein